ncbi:MAG: hypothetical protein EOO89_28430 [Pedobacter sp.]|nr:MAG: hypothetical protein EOO89_28430 [Pedobacter sp.]
MKKSNSEKGHAKNIANTGLLLALIHQKGDAYKPSNPNLAVKNLEKVAAEGEKVQSAVNLAVPLYSNAVMERINFYKPLNRYITKLRKSYKAVYGLTPKQLENFMTVARRIKGIRKSEKEPKGATPEQHSASQASYDQRANSMEMMAGLLKETKEFKPNEQEYKVETVTNMHKEMVVKNKAVASTYAPLNTARLKRDKILYTNQDNLVDLFNGAKDYLFSILETNSADYRAVGRIRFRKA